MVVSTFIYCKTCAKKTKHWDNTGTEKEKTLGKFVCSICKTPYNPKPREEQPKPVNQISNDKPSSARDTSQYYRKDYGNNVPKSMFGAWANNLVIACLEKDIIKTEKEAVQLFEKLVSTYDNILNLNIGQNTLKEKVKPQDIKEQEIKQEEKETDVEELLNSSDDFDFSNFNF